MTPAQKHILSLLSQLPLRESIDPTFSEVVRAHFTTAQRSWYDSAVRMAELDMARIRARDRKTARLVKETAAHDWAVKNLKVGDVVKVSGTRDGKGLRLVAAIRDGQMHCVQLRYRLKGSEFDSSSAIKTTQGTLVPTFTSSEHMLGKITYILRDEKFEPVPPK